MHARQGVGAWLAGPPYLGGHGTVWCGEGALDLLAHGVEEGEGKQLRERIDETHVLPLEALRPREHLHVDPALEQLLDHLDERRHAVVEVAVARAKGHGDMLMPLALQLEDLLPEGGLKRGIHATLLPILGPLRHADVFGSAANLDPLLPGPVMEFGVLVKSSLP